MPTTTNFFVPVLFPGAIPDGYTIGEAVAFAVADAVGVIVSVGTAPIATPTTGQIFPRGEG